MRSIALKNVQRRIVASPASPGDLFRLLVESVRDYAIFMLDPTGHVATWNEGAARIKGYSADEILGKHFAIFYPEAARAVRFPDYALECAARDGSFEDEGERVRKDGSTFFAHVVITAVYDPTGTLVGFAKVTRDMTQRKAAEENARRLAAADAARVESERAEVALRVEIAERERVTARLHGLLDASARLAASLDYDATLENLVRVTLTDIADLCVVDVFGADGAADDVAVAHVDPRKEGALRELYARFPGPGRAQPPFREAIDRGRAVLYPALGDAERRAFAVNDEHESLMHRVAPRSLIVVPLIARGTTLGVMALGRDVTNAYAEHDVMLATELARRAALAIDNARLFAQTREALGLRDEFLSIASHELNTPLTPLKMQVDSLRRGKHAPEKVAAKLEVVARQVVRITTLVSQLLDVSRITSGRLRLDPENVDVAALTREVVARMREEIGRSGSTIDARLEDGVVGHWDRMRLDQVIANLLSNAIKYGQGKAVTVAVERAGAMARITVRDRGIGIDAEHQARIFQRFERAVSSRHYGGFGLGLWIVRQILDASHGTIRVESNPGEGSTFTVELPLRGPGGAP